MNLNSLPSQSHAGIASGHPLVTSAARAILLAGGNAFDAMVAAAFTSCAVEPCLTSLGGGGFCLVRTADGQSRVLDFFVDTPSAPPFDGMDFHPITVQFPASTQVFHVGLAAGATPGNLKGFLHLHAAYGRLPLVDILAPAVAACKGHTLNKQQAETFSMLRPIVTLTAESRALFAPHGELLKQGDTFYNLDLATFLQALPHKRDRALYTGDGAALLVDHVRRHGGLITEEDITQYQVIERDPLTLDILDSGHTLITNSAPSLGGGLIALGLRVLEHNATPHPSPTQLAQMMIDTDLWRDRGVLEPEALTRHISTGGTTHISVLDAEGNAASLTMSNGEGCGHIIPGTGIMLNNMMGEDDLHPDGFHSSPPRTRVASMMSPSIITKDESVRYVLGSGGSKRIRTAILQVMINLLQHHMSLDDAVQTPRLHWDGSVIQLEPGVAEDLNALQTVAEVNRWPVKNMYFGGVHAVSCYGEAVGDQRRGGSAVVVAS